MCKDCFTCLKKLIMCICEKGSVFVHKYIHCLQEPEKGLRSPTSGVRICCELSDMGAEIWTQVFNKSNEYSYLLNHLSSPTVMASLDCQLDYVFHWSLVNSRGYTLRKLSTIANISITRRGTMCKSPLFMLWFGLAWVCTDFVSSVPIPVSSYVQLH